MKPDKYPYCSKQLIHFSIFCFIFSFFLLPFSLLSQPPVESYDQLLQAIRQTRQASTERIEQAVEQEKVREAWETGKLIDEHILSRKDRAEYGKQVIIRLSSDLEISQTELSLMLQFFRAYPNYSPGNNLSWSHYRALLSVNDEAQRQSVANKAEKEGWSRNRLRDEIQKMRSAEKQSSENLSSTDALLDAEPLLLPEIVPGKPGVYRVIRALAGPHQGKLVLDLGFSIYHELSEKEAKKFKDKDHVSVLRKRSAYKLSFANSTPKDLYTYSAYPYQVVDGDTFHAVIDLGFGVMIQQRIRLLRLDAPELVSADGKKAKEALEKILMPEGKGWSVLIQSKALDQHGRPLANVFAKSARSDKASADGTRTTGDEYEWQSVDPELIKSELFTIRNDE